MRRSAAPCPILAAPILAALVLTVGASHAHAVGQVGDAKEAVLQAAAKEPGARVTASGLVFRSLKDGMGAAPGATDTVRVHYRGSFPDGKEFDSSHSRGQPASFPLDRVIRCWTEALQLMKVGGKAQLTCPPDIAYGERGAGNGLIPANAVLRFEVELLGVTPR